MILMSELDRVNKVLEVRNARFIQLENDMNNRPQITEKDFYTYKRGFQEKENQLLMEIDALRMRISDYERNQHKIQYAAELSEKLRMPIRNPNRDHDHRDGANKLRFEGQGGGEQRASISSAVAITETSD